MVNSYSYFNFKTQVKFDLLCGVFPNIHGHLSLPLHASVTNETVTMLNCYCLFVCAFLPLPPTANKSVPGIWVVDFV